MDIGLRQYVDNPGGKGSAYLYSRQKIKRSLNETYVKMLQKYKFQFMAVPYIYPTGELLFYVRIPSEDYANNKITYDVLIEFDKDKSRRLAQRSIKLFSNSPNFVFTYAYVYNKNDLLIDTFKNRLPSLCLTQAPQIRNPIGSLGYEKSTYIAARYLLDTGCLTNTYINKNGKRMNTIEEKRLQDAIADPDKLVRIYQYAKHKQAKNPKKQYSQKKEQKLAKEQKDYVREHKNATRKLPKNKLVKVMPRGKVSAKAVAKKILPKK